ncbi:MAG: hypothetical protein V2J24_23385 [Pseudomonadales bacterium]|jgi:hypothetical protein|nr:hypothetical protein [Pseudomonadales bacterium]
MSARTSNTEQGEPAPFRDPNDRLARALSTRLQREIDACQRLLERLLGQDPAARDQPLEACRQAIRTRRAMLEDLSAARGSRSGAAAPGPDAALRERRLRA